MPKQSGPVTRERTVLFSEDCGFCSFMRFQLAIENRPETKLDVTRLSGGSVILTPVEREEVISLRAKSGEPQK